MIIPENYSFLLNNIDEMINKIFRGEIKLLTYFNQNSYNIYFENKVFREYLKSFFIYQEGIGMYLVLRLNGFNNCQRTDASEVNELILKKIVFNGESIVFIGGDYELNDLLKRSNMRQLKIELYHDGYFNEEKFKLLTLKLKSTKSKFVFVGMGTPQQEILAFELHQYFPDKIFICIGNFMNYFLGYQKRAPIILRKLQLEWIYRLFQEPKRLFKRYVIGIPLFFYRVFFHFK